MARLRKFVAYRSLDRPNTRKSKYRKKSFVRGAPTCKIVKFHTGNLVANFSERFDLVVTKNLQIRDNAIESARLAASRTLEETLGKNGYKLHIRPYPHHIVREHALAAGAGADRFSSGMAHAFGKPTANAVQMKKGKILISVHVNKKHINRARLALTKSNTKLPCKCNIVHSVSSDNKQKKDAQKEVVTKAKKADNSEQKEPETPMENKSEKIAENNNTEQ